MPSKRDHLVETALRLFNQHGYRATGIDRILGEAGVAKMTLYKHFASKDDLILAALDLRDRRFRVWIEETVANAADDPAQKLVAFFDAAETWFGEEDFNGCEFVRASGEYSDPDDPIHAAAVEHHRVLTESMRELGEAAGAKDAHALAEELMLLFIGATTAAQMKRCCSPAKHARTAAEAIVRAAVDR